MNFLLISTFFLAASVSAITLPSNCGHQASPVVSTGNERIVGGVVAKTGEWPWQVFLNKTITYDGVEVINADCGGAIVSKNYVLTAGHCVYDAVVKELNIKFDMEVIAGSVNIGDGSKRSPGEVRRKVAKVGFDLTFSQTLFTFQFAGNPARAL